MDKPISEAALSLLFLGIAAWILGSHVMSWWEALAFAVTFVVGVGGVVRYLAAAIQAAREP
jgi:hypothetical protein